MEKACIRTASRFSGKQRGGLTQANAEVRLFQFMSDGDGACRREKQDRFPAKRHMLEGGPYVLPGRGGYAEKRGYIMYNKPDGNGHGFLLAAASMAAEALALSRVVCAEGEALVRSPGAAKSAAGLLSAVTQAQRELNSRLETALAACGYFPNEKSELHFASRYNDFWWEGPWALPWKPLPQSGAGFRLDEPAQIRLLPGETCRLHISLTAFPIGGTAEIFLCIATRHGEKKLSLFTLRPKGPTTFTQAVELHTQTQAGISLGVNGPFGVCLIKAALDGVIIPPAGCAAGLLPGPTEQEEPLRDVRQSKEEGRNYRLLQCGSSEACRRGGNDV